MPVQTRIQLRHDTAANWTSTNPVLAVGEAGVETDTKNVKYGDGTTAWNSLAYGSTSNAGYIQFNSSPTGVPTASGVLSWNAVDKTLDLQSDGITYQLGQELAQNVKHVNSTGLTNGKVVFMTGSTGANVLVDYAIATSDATSANVIGVMTASASGAAPAPCTTFGLVRGIDTSAMTEGAIVWLSGTVAGGMTTTKPVAPVHLVKIGLCVRSHATEGVVFVSPQNGYELDELHDVLITSKTDGQVLTYEAASGLWKNKSVSGESFHPFLLMGA